MWLIFIGLIIISKFHRRPDAIKLDRLFNNVQESSAVVAGLKKKKKFFRFLNTLESSDMNEIGKSKNPSEITNRGEGDA